MTASASLRALLAGAIDYAGLFPPAGLSMSDAVARYADYYGTREAWALGRFVVPASRLGELTIAQRNAGATSQQWRLSVLLGDDVTADAARVQAFNAANIGAAFIDAVEMKAPSSPSAARGAIAAAVDALPGSTRIFVEITPGDELSGFMAVVADAGVSAKVRTGGVSSEAFPPVRQLARFLSCCAEHGTTFKATAGLHHPWRGRYALTYEPDAPLAPMFGFLNVLLAAAMARGGATEDDIIGVLQAERGSDFRFGEEDVSWGETRIPRADLAESHARFALSFGSCSFEEPIADLRRLALL